MKLLLILSWITALQTHPESTSGYSYSPANSDLSSQPAVGCSNNELKSSCGDKDQFSTSGYQSSDYSARTKSETSTGASDGNKFAGYPGRIEMQQTRTVGKPFNKQDSNQIPTQDSDKDQFGGYPGRRDSNSNRIATDNSGGNEFTGYPEKQMNSNQESGGYPERREMYTYQVSSTTGPAEVMQIQKHIYFHAAPPEPESEPQQRRMGTGSRQKHYNIIFIDTSRFSAIPRQQQQTQAIPNEEKTIVYVLVKKPDDQIDTAAPTGPTAPLNKPEVFFIKYKEKSEYKATMPIAEGKQPKKDDTNKGQYLPPNTRD